MPNPAARSPAPGEPMVAPISPAQRRFLVVEQGIGAAIFNFILNGLIAWLVFRGHASVPLWGDQSIAGDTIATAFLLPLITAIVVTPLARRQLGSGKLEALGWTRTSHPKLRLLPRGTVPRGVVLGAACVVTVAPVTIAILWALGVEAMSLPRFLLFKASFAALLAVPVTPILALWAITPAITRR